MMYNTLQLLNNVAEITYYTINGSMSGQATKAGVLGWITDHAWNLAPYDTMLIFFTGHGGGMNKFGTALAYLFLFARLRAPQKSFIDIP